MGETERTANAARKATCAAKPGAAPGTRRRPPRGLLRKSLSILLAVLLLTAAFPLSPARGEVVSFTVTVSVQETISETYTYTFDEDDVEAQIAKLTGSADGLRIPEGYSDSVQVDVNMESTVAAVYLGGDEGGYVEGGRHWFWSVDYSLGQLPSGRIVLNNGGEVWFEIPELQEIPWISRVLVNDKEAEFAGGNYYYADGKSGNNTVEIQTADEVIILEQEPFGDWAPGGDGGEWTLNLSEGGNEARLDLTLGWDGLDDAPSEFFQIFIYAPLPEIITGVTVNGQTAAGGFDGEVYTYTAAVSQAAGNTIEIRPASEYVTVSEGNLPETTGGDWAMVDEEDWTFWLLDFYEYGSATLFLSIVDNEHEGVADFYLTVTYKAQSSGGGGGGGGGGGAAPPPPPAAPEIDVTNETNQPNATSDTVLTPANTTESGGHSATTVTSAEVQAMVDMAGAHSGDVPDGENEAIIQIADQTPAGNYSYEVNLSGGDVAAIAGSAIDVLSVSTGASEFRMRSEALQGLGAGSGDTVQIRLARIDRNGKPGIDAVLVAGQKIVTMVDGVYTIEIRIPYQIRPGEDPNSLCIEYLREDGETELVTESKYDTVRQTVSFFPSHLSKYGVAYRPVLYSDVKPGHWANSYITFLAARDVITNAPGTKYRPDDAITRAEFINMAARAFSAANLGKRSLQSYRDVPADAWYARAVGWSYMNNISPVLASGGNFYPDRGLNREETATLANNISLSVSLRLRADNPARFSDAGAISPFAQSATTRMASCGIIPEAGGGRFLPKGNSTRADAARSISLMLAKMR